MGEILHSDSSDSESTVGAKILLADASTKIVKSQSINIRQVYLAREMCNSCNLCINDVI